MAKAVLIPGKEKRVYARHPWVFRSDIARVEGEVLPGDIVSVYSSKGHFLAKAYYNPASQISLRVMSLRDEPIDLSPCTQNWNFLYVQDAVKQSALKRIFQRGARLLLQKTDSRLQQHLSNHKQCRQDAISPKIRTVSVHSTVHDVPQKERIQHTAAAVKRLYQHQCADIVFLFSCDLPEPLDRIMLHKA